MMDKLNKLISTLSFYFDSFILTDVMMFNLIGIFICVIAFFVSYPNPLLLLIVLEVSYLFINTNFILYFTFNNFSTGILNVLIIIGISAAETIVGLTFVILISKSENNFFDINDK